MPRVRRLRAGALGAVVVLGVTGCGSPEAAPPESSSRSSSRLALQEIDFLASAMGCVHQEILRADVNHYDDMVGVNCFYHSGETVLLRVYEASTSPDQVLVDVIPTFSPNNQVAVGVNWYATGTPTRIVTAMRRLGVDAKPTARYVPHPEPLSAHNRYLGMCSGFVASVVRGRAFQPTELDGQEDEMEQVYPGIGSVVGSVVRELGEVVESEFDVRISELAPVLRSFCRQAAEEVGA